MKRALIVLIGLGLVLSACSKSTPVATPSSEGPVGKDPCVITPSPIADPAFPTGFPTIGDVTWIASANAGPSQVINGYTGDPIDSLFAELQDLFAKDGYSVTKHERDAHDAEVGFVNATSTGQIALAEECQGRTSVRITIRPK